MRLTLEQARMDAGYAATWGYAFQTRDGQRVVDASKAKEWKTQVMGFGTNVQRCGLLQALAFLRRDAEHIYEAIQTALSDHLRDRGFLTLRRGDDLLEVVRKLPAMDYMLVSREVLGVALWLKRAAQILCQDPPARAERSFGGPDA
jgi:hypothetical protein